MGDVELIKVEGWRSVAILTAKVHLPDPAFLSLNEVAILGPLATWLSSYDAGQSSDL